MAFSFFKKMFGSADNDASVEVPQLDETPDIVTDADRPGRHERIQMSADEIEDGIKGLESFVEYTAKQLVDNADAVSVETVEKDRLTVIRIRCEKRDIGKLIGKSGKTIAAIRLLVSGAAGRMGLRMTVDVLD